MARAYVSQLDTPSLHQHAEMDVSAQPAFPIVFSPRPRTWNDAHNPWSGRPLSPLINLSVNALTDMSHDLSPTNVILNPVKLRLSVAHPSLITEPLYLATSKCVFEGYYIEGTLSNILPCWAFGMNLQVVVQMRGFPPPPPLCILGYLNTWAQLVVLV